MVVLDEVAASNTVKSPSERQTRYLDNVSGSSVAENADQPAVPIASQRTAEGAACSRCGTINSPPWNTNIEGRSCCYACGLVLFAGKATGAESATGKSQLTGGDNRYAQWDDWFPSSTKPAAEAGAPPSFNRPYAQASTDSQRRYIGVTEVLGEGSYHVYEGGYRLPTHVDGEYVHPVWGRVKARNNGKRPVVLACLDCRNLKIKCEPGIIGCRQCERHGLTCRRAPTVVAKPHASDLAYRSTSSDALPENHSSSGSDQTPYGSLPASDVNALSQSPMSRKTSSQDIEDGELRTGLERSRQTPDNTTRELKSLGEDNRSALFWRTRLRWESASLSHESSASTLYAIDNLVSASPLDVTGSKPQAKPIVGEESQFNEVAPLEHLTDVAWSEATETFSRLTSFIDPGQKPQDPIIVSLQAPTSWSDIAHAMSSKGGSSKESKTRSYSGSEYSGDIGSVTDLTSTSNTSSLTIDLIKERATGPPRPPLASSESRARFLERLGMDERNESHRRVYAMMKEESIEGRRRMTADPDSLAPQFRNDVNVEPPYSVAQISETAFRREISRIYNLARRETRVAYDLGRDPNSDEGDSWVIRWMLWHVCKYRDNRNRRVPQEEPEESSGILGRHGNPMNQLQQKSFDNGEEQQRNWDDVETLVPPESSNLRSNAAIMHPRRSIEALQGTDTVYPPPRKSHLALEPLVPMIYSGQESESTVVALDTPGGPTDIGSQSLHVDRDEIPYSYKHGDTTQDGCEVRFEAHINKGRAIADDSPASNSKDATLKRRTVTSLPSPRAVDEKPAVKHHTRLWVLAKARRLLRMLRPQVAKGHQRLEWICSCGQDMYGDYSGPELAQLKQKFSSIRKQKGTGSVPDVTLPADPVTDGADSPHPQNPATSQQSPTSSSASSSHQRSTSSPSQSNSVRSSSPGSQLSLTSSSTSISIPTSMSTPVQSYLELCVNRSKYLTRIGEIQLVDSERKLKVKSDFELFARIHGRYYELRRQGLQRYLYRPCDVQFVLFGIRRGVNQVGIYNKTPVEIPPEDEVREGRYHYYECPILTSPPMDKRTFFHYFWDHAQHFPSEDLTFHDRLPKKLGCSILMAGSSTPLMMGWGVHIIEGPNKPLLAWLATAILVLSFAISLAYDIGLKSKESGFAIGQWMVAVLTTALTAVYFHLADLA